jgi:hypothetical protein
MWAGQQQLEAFYLLTVDMGDIIVLAYTLVVVGNYPQAL